MAGLTLEFVTKPMIPEDGAMTLTARIRDVAWSAYVWPKGRAGNRLQGLALSALEGRRVRREWERAERVILVHTPGKVGSKAMVAGLTGQLTPYDVVFHTHRINPRTFPSASRERTGLAPRRTWYTTEFLGYALSGDHGKDVAVLSAVRDPMQRNLSAFFQNVERYTTDRRPLTHNDVGQASHLAELFLARFPHRQVCEWVDTEIADMFGLNPYDVPFDIDRGFMVLQRPGLRIGIARHDRLPEVMGSLAEAVVSVQISQLPRTNDSGAKRYAPLYRALVENVRMPQDILSSLYDSMFARHFFSDEERAVAVKRWSAAAGT